MMRLILPHKFRIPDGLAILAAFLLLLSSTTGNNTSQAVYSATEGDTPVTTTDASSNQENIDAATVSKRRGLNLGFLLFRRG